MSGGPQVFLGATTFCVTCRQISGCREEHLLVPVCLVCPWAAARPLAVRAASFARRVVSNPGQAPPPPMGDLSFVVHRVSSVHLAPSLVCLRSAMKPTAPLLALPCSGMKPPSPLRARKGLFRANSNLQRCWRFQWGAQRGVQRCWRFQSWSVIASCARKSSPRISRSCRGARKSSPCKPKTGEKRCLLVRWASFSRKNRCKLSS